MTRRLDSPSALALVLFALGSAFSACAVDTNGTLAVSGGTSSSSAASSSSSTSTGAGSGGAGGTSGAGGAGGQAGAGGQGGIADVCGNGMMGPTEQCDDGNTVPADGCSADCQTENADACGGVTIKLNKGSSFEVKGDTSGANDDTDHAGSSGSCQGGGPYTGPDLVYGVIPQQSGALVATLNANYSNHWMHTRTSCLGTTSDEIDCDYSTMKSEPDVNMMNVDAGKTYYVIVDGHSTSNNQGSFTLKLELQ